MRNVDLNKLDTEKINVNTAEIHSKSSREIVKLINNEDKKVAFAVERELEDIAKIIDLAEETLMNKGRIIYLGAGNSGRIATGDACECIPTFGVEPNTVICVLAGGDSALLSANEGAEDDAKKAEEDLEKITLNENDFVIGLSASGRTPYVIGGLVYAIRVGCKTASIACSRSSKISQIVNVAVEVAVGPEAITGSTRLKAGTAQKMVVNMISTGTMIRIGKVYKNYMVDLSIKNEKLYERGKRIIKEVTEVTDEVAEEYLRKSNGKVKIAILMILKGLTAEECENLIETSPNICNLI